MYMYLCYYMDENNTIPYPIWEKLYQQYMKQYEKSDWNTKEERRKLKALGLIDYGNGIDTKVFVGRGLYADRSVAETLLKYRNYRDSIFCLYEILLKEENEEIKIKDFMYDYGFAVSTCKYTSAAMKNLYQALYFLKRIGFIDLKRVPYGEDDFELNTYYMKVCEPEKFEWKGIKIIQF